MRELRCDVVAQVLRDLDDDDQDDDREDHDAGLVAVVAVLHRQVADAASADHAGHGAAPDEVDEDHRHRAGDRRGRLAQQHLPHYQQAARAGGERRLDDTVVDFLEAALDEAGQEDGRGDGHRHRCGHGTYLGADEVEGQREREHHEDDEWDRPYEVHDARGDGVQGAVFKEGAGLGQVERKAQQQSEDQAKRERDPHHDGGLVESLPQLVAQYPQCLLKHLKPPCIQ